MAPEPSILVVGALHLDVVVDAPHLPAPDETVVGHAVAYRFGGKGGNQAVAAVRMGARVAMAGRVGPDRFGEQVLAALDAAGVERSRVLTVPGASGMSVAIVDAAGDYGAVIVSGVNRDIDGAAVAFPGGLRTILLQGEVPEAVNLAIAARAAPDVRLILNAAPARPVAAELLARVDVLVANRGEAATLSGTDDPQEAAARLLSQGARAVIVTLGAGGLVCATPGAPPLVLPAPRVDVISTHGAGDAFTGALAAELTRGGGLTEALVFAQGAAALTVATHPDLRDAVTPGAVRAFLNAL
jgi:ribokinase